MSLPTDSKARKVLPIFRGPLMYFPDAMLEVARVCALGNAQHNAGEPLHWDRNKSMEQLDTALRHMMDHGMGTPKDIDGGYHMAKAAWRCLAELQLQIERDRSIKQTSGNPIAPRMPAITEEIALKRVQRIDPHEPYDDVVRIVSARTTRHNGETGVLLSARSQDPESPFRVQLENGSIVWCSAVGRVS